MYFQEKKEIKEGKGYWTVIVNDLEWKQAIEKAEKTLASNLIVPGFRKGKVPQHLVAQHLTKNNVLKQAHKSTINHAYNFALKQDYKIKPFDKTLNTKVLKINSEEYVVEFSFDLIPVFAIKKYKGFNIPKNVITVTDKEIETEIAKFVNEFAMLSDKTGAIKKGDVVILDFKGHVDNKLIFNGAAKDYELEIGSNSFIPGFEEKLIGLNKDTKTKIKVVFPKDYPKKELQNKETIFDIHIKKIQRKRLPELTDALVKDFDYQNTKTIPEFKKALKDTIKKNKLNEEYTSFKNKLFREIATESGLIIPSQIIDKEVNRLKRIFEQKVIDNKLDIKSYRKQTGLTDENIKSYLLTDAKNNIENTIIIQHILKSENLKATKEQIDKEYNKLSKEYNIPVETVKTLVDDKRIQEMALSDTLLQFIYNNN